MKHATSALLVLLCAITHLPGETPAVLRIVTSPAGFVTLTPERPALGELFLMERSPDLIDWQPVMPARLSRAEDQAVIVPQTGARHYYRYVVRPAPEAAMIPVAYNSLGSAYLLGKFEVTVGEWNAVAASAAAFGYDLAPDTSPQNPDLPVSADWFDSMKWCNLRSEFAGLPVAYHVNGNPYRTGKTVPTIDIRAKGYRLPHNHEWDFAVRGGLLGQGFAYSGSNDIDEVAWYLSNSDGGPDPGSSGLGPRPVGWKKANELGFHDMNGNLWEWCWEEWPFNTALRRMRGGHYATPKNICTCGAQGGAPPSATLGFRVARNP